MGLSSSAYDAVLFDFDGVIVDSEPIHYRCWTEILAEFGIAMEWPVYVQECVGVADRTMLENLSAQWPGKLRVADLVGAWEPKKARFRELMLAEMPLAPGLADLLKRLRGRSLAVVSSSGRSEVEPILEAAGLRRHFDALVCGWEAGALKPAPAPYLKAAELLGARRPLVVEDSATGEMAAVAAGFDVVRVGSTNEVARAVLARIS